MKILLIRSGGLGDCILTLPVACQIKKIYPGAELHVLGNETMLAAARLSNEFSGYNSIDTQGFHLLYTDSEPSEFLKSFFSRFDIVYFYSSGNKELLKRNILESGAGKCSILDPRPPDTPQCHIADHLMSIFSAAGKNSGCGVYSENSDEMRCGIPGQSTKTTSNIKKLVIHPGSGGISKIWPIENFLYAADNISMDATFLLGQVEIERGTGKAIPVDKYNIIQTANIAQLSSHLAEASLYIGNDSGVSHLASYVGTRSIVLFGPTDPAVWRPIGGNVTIISSPDGDIKSISREEVISKIHELNYES
ncbi:glycosyltransferase family 9 protein [Candidatus Latescibacterota bacterium]